MKTILLMKQMLQEHELIRMVRGKDIIWRDVYNNDINEESTQKKNDCKYGEVYNYVCKFSRRVGFLPSDLSFHEDTLTWNQLYTFIHSLDNHFNFLMGDGDGE